MALVSAPVPAAQNSGTVTLIPTLVGAATAPSSGLCRNLSATGSFGATVTVVCSTGAMVDIEPGLMGMPWIPTHGGAYRYITQVSTSAGLVGTVDVYSGIGSVTSLRVVSGAEREFLELTIGW